jgi:hypothetical protein
MVELSWKTELHKFEGNYDFLLFRGEEVFASRMSEGVRFRRSGNIHVRPNSLWALPRHT